MSHLPELDTWTGQLAEALGLSASDIDIAAVLDLARDAAHGIARPAAPLTAYLVGVAVGRGIPFEEANAAVQRLLPETG